MCDLMKEIEKAQEFQRDVDAGVFEIEDETGREDYFSHNPETCRTCQKDR